MAQLFHIHTEELTVVHTVETHLLLYRCLSLTCRCHVICYEVLSPFGEWEINVKRNLQTVVAFRRLSRILSCRLSDRWPRFRFHARLLAFKKYAHADCCLTFARSISTVVFRWKVQNGSFEWEIRII